MNSNYYVKIPASVRYDNDLPAGAKLLYGELMALDSDDDGCYARNVHFAKLYGVNVRTIQKWLKQLIDKGFVSHKAYKEQQSGKRTLHAKVKPKGTGDKYKQESYDDVFDNCGVTGEYRQTFWRFIKHCNLNKRALTNDKLYDIIVRLDLAWQNADLLKMQSLTDAINGGFFDVKEGRE